MSQIPIVKNLTGYQSIILLSNFKHGHTIRVLLIRSKRRTEIRSSNNLHWVHKNSIFIIWNFIIKHPLSSNILYENRKLHKLQHKSPKISEVFFMQSTKNESSFSFSSSSSWVKKRSQPAFQSYENSVYYTYTSFINYNTYSFFSWGS